MSGINYTVAPSSFPVTRTQALLYLKQPSGTSDDDLVDDLIEMAVEQVQLITEHQLNTATSIQYFDGWPRSGVICLDRPPLNTVTSVKYLDSDGVEQTISASDYTVNIRNEARGTIAFSSSFTFPELDDDRQFIDSVFVEFVSGYQAWTGLGAAPAVPAMFRTVIKAFVNELYEHRMLDQEAADVGALLENCWAMQLLRSKKVNSPSAIGLGGSIPNVVI